MHVSITNIVPNSFRIKIDAECVTSLLEMGMSVLPFISPAAYFGADETLPKTCFNVTNFTFQRAVVDFIFSLHFALEFVGTKVG